MEAKFHLLTPATESLKVLTTTVRESLLLVRVTQRSRLWFKVLVRFRRHSMLINTDPKVLLLQKANHR